MKKEQSKQWSLNNIDYKKLLIGAGVALLGALATYMADTIPGLDFGVWTPIVVAVNSVIVNAIRKFIMGV